MHNSGGFNSIIHIFMFMHLIILVFTQHSHFFKEFPKNICRTEQEWSFDEMIPLHVTSFWMFNLTLKDVFQDGQSNIISLGGADLRGSTKKIPYTRTFGFKNVRRQKAVLGILQHLLIFLIRPLLRHLLFLYMCCRIPAICLLGVFNFGFLLICRLSGCPPCPLVLFLDSLMMHGGKTSGISQYGILGQHMLCGNSEMLHIADLIFTIKGPNLNFRKS